MIPSTGPSKPLTKINKLLISLIRNHGQIMIPIIPVIRPPILKLIFFGYKLENALDGAITFAAIFVLNVAMDHKYLRYHDYNGIVKLGK